MDLLVGVLVTSRNCCYNPPVKIFLSSCRRLRGTSLVELTKQARKEFHSIQKLTPRRQPYIRSRYFEKDKIFISQFWDHLRTKERADKVRRLRFYSCAIDLLRNTFVAPEITQNPDNSNELLHRFLGKSADGERYYVQVKENRKSGRKDFMSTFPVKQKRPSAL